MRIRHSFKILTRIDRQLVKAETRQMANTINYIPQTGRRGTTVREMQNDTVTRKQQQRLIVF